MQLSPPQPPAFHSVTGDIADKGIDTITVSKLAFNPLTPIPPETDLRSWGGLGDWGAPLILRRVYDQTLGPPQADHSRGACPRGNGACPRGCGEAGIPERSQQKAGTPVSLQSPTSQPELRPFETAPMKHGIQEFHHVPKFRRSCPSLSIKGCPSPFSPQPGSYLPPTPIPPLWPA
jgi:hypothetical protein